VAANLDVATVTGKARRMATLFANVQAMLGESENDDSTLL
jgi:hypothetical protein